MRRILTATSGSENGRFSEKVGEQSEDGVDVSAGRAVYQGCGDDRASVGLEESFAQGAGIRNEDADLLHQSSGKGAEQVPVGGTGKSEEAAFKASKVCAGKKGQVGISLVRAGQVIEF